MFGINHFLKIQNLSFIIEYRDGATSLEATFNLMDDAIKYFYQIGKDSRLTNFSIEDEDVKQILEKNKNLSVDYLRKATKNYKNNFIEDLNKIKSEKLTEIKANLTLRINILIAAFVAGFFLMMLFSLVKV